MKSRGFLPDDVGLHMQTSKRRSWGQKSTPIIRRGREEGKDSLRKLQLSSLVEMEQRTDKGTIPTEQKRCGTINLHTSERTKRYTLEGRIWGSKVWLVCYSIFSNRQQRHSSIDPPHLARTDLFVA